jgi:hypothetical protein
MRVSNRLFRRMERLKARFQAARQRVWYVWWGGYEPYSEPAEGERLIVIRWRGDDDDAHDALSVPALVAALP